MTSYPFDKQRVTYADGTWADVITVRFRADELRFRDIVLPDSRTRMQDVAHLRYVKARLRNEENPIIVAWACLEEDFVCTEVFPTVNNVTDDGEHLLSANSLINYTLRTLLDRGWLFYKAKHWCIDIPNSETIWKERAQQVLDWLLSDNRLWLQTPPQHIVSRSDFDQFQTDLNAVPAGRAGFLRNFVTEEQYRIAFNTAYFLLEDDDYFSHHSALGNPYGLAVYDGEIVRPPLYKRAVFWCDENGVWQTDVIGMSDIQLHLPQ